MGTDDPSGVYVTRGVWNHFELDVNFINNTVNAVYNSTPLVQNVSFSTASTTLGLYAFYAQPNATTDAGYFDNFSITASTGGNSATFTPTDMATLNGTQENSITLLTSANVSGSFPYLAADGGSAGQNMITVVGLVNNSGQWVGGTPQVVYNGVPSQGGSSGIATWSNLVVPSSSGTCQLWFQSYLTTSTSAAIGSFESSPPTVSGYLSGIVATVIVGNPPSFAPTAMATLNGTQENSITLAPSAYLSGSFPYLSADGGSPGQNVITVIGLVNNANQWVGGTPQIIYNGVPSQAGSTGTASWANMVVPSSQGTYQLWFQSFLTTSTSVIYSFEAAPPTASGDLAGIVATVVVGNPSSFTGGLTGRVLGNGSPLGNAKVRLENTSFYTNTMSNGTFSFSSIPSGNGYVLDVSAAGYNSARLTGMNVPIVNINNVGDILLTSIGGGAYTLKEMLNVNPAITTVEQGGTAYRYYCVLNASGNPQGGIAVSAQTSDGAAIPQNDVSSVWPGSVAGTSDGDAYGTVRIAVPASVLNQNGVIQTIQLSISGQVQKTFQAQVMPRQYAQIWKQKLGGGVSVGELLTAEVDSSSESDLYHNMVNGSVVSECISRIREDKLEAGIGFKLDASVSLASAEISGGTGLSAGSVLRSTYTFDPNSTDPTVNAMKLYTDLGNLLSDPTLNPVGNAIYGFVDSTIAPSALNSSLRSVEADLQAGPYAQINANLGVGLSDNVQVGVQGGASVSADLIGGYEQRFGNNSEVASVSGASGSVSDSLSIGLTLGNEDDNLQITSQNLSLAANYNVELLNKMWTHQGQNTSYRTESTRELDLGQGQPITVTAWQRYDPQTLYANYDRDFKETIEHTNGNIAANYQWSVYASETEIQGALGFDIGFGLNFNGELDRGVEEVGERGALFNSRYWPSESYSPITTDLFPTQSWLSIISQWGQNAVNLNAIGQVINQAFATIANTGNTLVQAGQAYLNIASGALNSGDQVVSSWVSGHGSHRFVGKTAGEVLIH